MHENSCSRGVLKTYSEYRSERAFIDYIENNLRWLLRYKCGVFLKLKFVSTSNIAYLLQYADNISISVHLTHRND